MALDVSGNAKQLREALHTEMHNLVLPNGDQHVVLPNGDQHVANMRDPQIPAALATVGHRLKEFRRDRFHARQPQAGFPRLQDPGASGDEDQAALDVEWSSAAAPDANIELVACGDTKTASGLDRAILGILESAPPDIISISYGGCETGDTNFVYSKLAAEQFESQGASRRNSSQAGGKLSATSCVFNDITFGDIAVPCGQDPDDGKFHACFGASAKNIGELSLSGAKNEQAFPREDRLRLRQRPRLGKRPKPVPSLGAIRGQTLRCLCRRRASTWRLTDGSANPWIYGPREYDAAKAGVPPKDTPITRSLTAFPCRRTLKEPWRLVPAFATTASALTFTSPRPFSG